MISIIIPTYNEEKQIVKTLENLNHWISNEPTVEKSTKTVAIVMAGNIPLVGFHDFISVLLSGHSVLVKQSSND